MFASRLLLLLLPLATLPFGACQHAGTPPKGPATAAGWTRIWSDEFTGPAGSPIDPAHWQHDIGHGYPNGGPANWGTGEIETMTSSTSNVYVDGAGHLAIRPIRGADGTWTSGRVESIRNDFRAPAGGALAVEISARLPAVNAGNGRGYWPALWLLGGAYRGTFKWPAVGEIDIAEAAGGRDSIIGTLHCGATIPGPCNEYTGISSGERPCGGCSSAYHVFRIELDRGASPEQIRWYLDGVNYFTVLGDRVDAATWTAATSGGFMVILNVAIGGGLPAALGGGPTAATLSGAPLVIDYVRIYQR